MPVLLQDSRHLQQIVLGASPAKDLPKRIAKILQYPQGVKKLVLMVRDTIKMNSILAMELDSAWPC